MRRIKSFKHADIWYPTMPRAKRLTSNFGVRCKLRRVPRASYYSSFSRVLLAMSTPSIRWQYSIWHGVLSPIHFPLPSRILILARYLLGPDYRAAIAKADLRTFTRGNGVDRTMGNASNEPLSISSGCARYYRDTASAWTAHASFACTYLSCTCGHFIRSL